MKEIMPKFNRLRSLGENYLIALRALGFLEESAFSEEDIQEAEGILKGKMPSFKIGPSSFNTQENFKSAAFFLLLARQKEWSQFTMESEDNFAFTSYTSEAIISDAQTNPGKYPIIDLIRRSSGTITVMVCINVA